MNIVVRNRVDGAPDGRVTRSKRDAYAEAFEVDVDARRQGDYIIIDFEVDGMSDAEIARACVAAEESSGIATQDLDVNIETESTLVDGRPIDVVALAH